MQWPLSPCLPLTQNALLMTAPSTNQPFQHSTLNIGPEPQQYHNY
jgi:hypothetical protein